MTYYQIYRKTKYNNKKCNVNGKIYDSRGEADYGMELELRKKAGDIKDYKEQVPIDIIFNGVKITRYKIDFEILHNDDTIEYIEYKGCLDYASNIRWKCFTAFFANDPNVKCTMVRHQSNYQYWKNRAKKGN